MRRALRGGARAVPLLALSLLPAGLAAGYAEGSPPRLPRAAAVATNTWERVSGPVVSGSWAMQAARTADGVLHVPVTIKDASNRTTTSDLAIGPAGPTNGRGVVDAAGCTDDHAFTAWGASGNDLLAVAGGLPLAPCTTDEMVAYLAPAGAAFGPPSNGVQFGNHAYNAGHDNLAVVATSPTTFVTAYTAPEGLVIGRSGAGYSSSNPTPVFDACCSVEYPNLAYDGVTNSVHVTWLAYDGGWVEKHAVLDGTTLAPRLTEDFVPTVGASQRTALTTVVGRGAVLGALVKKSPGAYATAAWVSPPGPAGPWKSVFGHLGGADVFSNLAVSGSRSGPAVLWAAANVWQESLGRYAYVARRWDTVTKGGWGPPLVIPFPRGVPDGVADVPFAVIADTRPDGMLDLVAQPGLAAPGLYHMVVAPPSTKAAWKARHGRYQVRLPKGTYVETGEVGRLRLKVGGHARKVKVHLSPTGRATVRVKGTGKVVPRSLKVVTGQVATTYHF